jgi:hypothetical protein
VRVSAINFDGTVTLISPSSDAIQRLAGAPKPQISLECGMAAHGCGGVYLGDPPDTYQRTHIGKHGVGNYASTLAGV